MFNFRKNKKIIICIGPNKTGTSSLSKAFNILGFKSHHDIDDFRKKVIKANQNNKKMFHYLSRYSAFSDFLNPYKRIGYPDFSYKNIKKIIKNIDRDYPDSLYILNIRNKKDWIKSRMSHVEKNKRKCRWFRKNWTNININKWEEEFDTLKKVADEYFKEKPNKLLVMDVCNGDGWEKLCPFLNKDIPKTNFPHINKTR